MESPECHDKFISKFRAVIGQSPIDEQMRALSYFGIYRLVFYHGYYWYP